MLLCESLGSIEFVEAITSTTALAFVAAAALTTIDGGGKKIPADGCSNDCDRGSEISMT